MALNPTLRITYVVWWSLIKILRFVIVFRYLSKCTKFDDHLTCVRLLKTQRCVQSSSDFIEEPSIYTQLKSRTFILWTHLANDNVTLCQPMKWLEL